MCFGGELAKVAHDVGNLFLFDEVLFLVVEEREALIYLGLEVLFTLGLLGHGEIVVPEHQKLYIQYRKLSPIHITPSII